MRVDLERRNLLFKTKNTNKQLASNNNDREGDERHNMVKGGRMLRRETKVVDLVGEYLQTYNEKKKRIGAESRRGRREEEGASYLFSSITNELFVMQRSMVPKVMLPR
jgi:hypothetical protein